jgi:hypothetical protein
MSSATSTAIAHSGGGQSGLTREQVLAMGTAGRHWEFVPAGLAALDVAPEDHQVRLLVAGAFGALGLKTAALEHAARLPDSGEARELRGALATLAVDELQTGRLVRSARALAHALGARGIDLAKHIGAWRERLEGEQWFAARDGNIAVRQRAGGAWRVLGDTKGRSARAELPWMAEAGTDEALDPVYVDGLASPWLLERVAATTPPIATGYQPAVAVVVETVEELFDACAMRDIRGCLCEERVRVFAGDGWRHRLDAWLTSRRDVIVRGPIVSMRADGRSSETLGEIVGRHIEAQASEAMRLRREVHSVYAHRDGGFWRKRYAEARASGEALRVLVRTTRNSTFLKHSAEDLCAALAAQGCEAHVLAEPDRCSKLASPAYLRLFAEWRPDLVVQFNYPRAKFKDVVPANVPYVCWVQDRMSHLFDPAMGAAQTELDFLVGHCFGELFTEFGYDAARAKPLPVVCSTEKFHAGPVDADLAKQFACDVAYVSHQSETPEAMVERLASRMHDRPLLQRFLKRVAPAFKANVETMPEHRRMYTRWHLACEQARAEDAALAAVDQRILWRDFGAPFCERVVRMQTLRWAADACARNGWMMRLFGRGWEKHPEFARYAAGPLEHGEAIRACYQSARAHLHASAFTTSHQRVFECALSGGLMLRRIAVGDLEVIEQEIMRRYVERSGCATDVAVIAVEDSAPETVEEMAAYNAMREAAGLQRLPVIKVRGPLIGMTMARPRMEFEQFFEWSAPRAGETVFRDGESIERVMRRAVEDERWRDEVVGAQGAFVRDLYTYGGMARELVEWVGR